MGFRLLSQNFYELNDPLHLVDGVFLNGSPVAYSNDVVFIAEEGVLSIHTVLGGDFSYDVIEDSDGEQQIYSLRMSAHGLDYSVPTTEELSVEEAEEAEGVLPVTLVHAESSVYVDHDFWFTSVLIHAFMPNNVIVDSVAFQASEEVNVAGLGVMATQLNDELVMRMAPTIFNLSPVGPHTGRFKISSGDATYVSDAFEIVAHDPALSECAVSGTPYDIGSPTSEAAINSRTGYIVLTLRFETWVDDEIALRSVLSLFTSEPFNVNEGGGFYAFEPAAATNERGLADVIQGAVVYKSSPQELIVEVGQPVLLRHPERLLVGATLPPETLASGNASVAVVEPFSQTVYPSPGSLRVLTTTLANYFEKDFWTGEVTLMFEVEDDAWQDVSILTDAARLLFVQAVKDGMTSSSDAWNDMVRDAELTLATSEHFGGVGILHVTFPQQTSGVFNIGQTIEVGVNFATSVSGFHLLLSGATPPSSFFVVRAVHSYISCDTAQLTESDVWSRPISVVLLFVDDEIVATQETVASHVIGALQSAIGAANITTANTTVAVDTNTITIGILQASPSSFNIPDDIRLALTFPGSLLRNGNDLTAPAVAFLTTPVEVSVSGVEDVTADTVVSGFALTLSLLHDVWGAPPLDYVTVRSRSHAANGWNATVEPHLVFGVSPEDASTLTVTIPPDRGYAVSLTEVVDIFINARSTRNGGRLYVTNFSIQGASASERRHHAYVEDIKMNLRYASELKGVLNKIKTYATARMTTVATTTDAAATHNFSTTDTVSDRLRKINDASINGPIAICKPALLNAVPSIDTYTFVLSLHTSLQPTMTIPTTPLTDRERGVPVCLPPVRPAMAKQLFTILLHKVTDVTLHLNGAASQLHGTDAFVLLLDPSADSLFISGDEIIDRQIL